MNWQEQILEWAKVAIPSALSAFAYGYRVGNAKVKELKSDLMQRGLELNYEKNRTAILKKYTHLSDDDIVKHAILEGRELKHPGGGG